VTIEGIIVGWFVLVAILFILCVTVLFWNLFR
jgi:hypothetical protein